MIRNLATKITVLLFVMMTFFSVSAHAYQGGTFRLVIQDTTNGIQRVITDGVQSGIGNLDGDQNPATAGTIQFSGIVGGFNVTITGTSSTGGSDGGGVLTLTGTIKNQSSTGLHEIVIGLEDTGYAPAGSSVLFTSTATGNLGSANAIALNSWMDAAGDDPNYGSNSKQVTLVAGALNVPASATLNPDENSLTALSGPSSQGSVGVNLGATGYSIFSTVTVDFPNGTTGGTANFTLTSQDGTPASVPEPTSLLLVGSTMLGLGLFRKRF